MGEKRSNNMKAIKGKDTSLELKVRKYLYHHGFRYRKNVRGLPGTPDIVIDKYHVCIFVNGCFWHHHYHCKLATVPKSHHDYWVKKIERNIERDREKDTLLRSLGWTVIHFWGKEIEKDLEGCLQTIEEMIFELKMSEVDDNGEC